MEVSENTSTPKSSISIGFFIVNIYKPSIWGYLHLWKPPNIHQPQHKQRLPVPHPSPSDCPRARRLSRDLKVSTRFSCQPSRAPDLRPGLAGAQNNTKHGGVRRFQAPKMCVFLNGKNHDSHGEKVRRWVDFGMFHDLKQQLAIPKKESSNQQPPGLS